MLFNTAGYWIFFFVVLALFYSVRFQAGKILLLLASYYFYMQWDPRLIVLILASTIIDYFLGIWLESSSVTRKKWLLVTSLVVNLGILGFFKYYNFFADSLAALLGLPEKSFALQIILPIGISFYTFASLSYTIDVYRGQMKAVRNFIDYAFFIAFFPHLIAGPIIRARRFIGQIYEWQKPTRFIVQSGIVLILAGLIKKMIFADRFGMISDDYFKHPASHPGWLAAWSGSFAFLMQIFFDFSGYTDIARGCARLLGFEFPLNFARPYLARNLAEFWQRWHMTLTSWLRDYVYTPLTRRSRRRVVIYRSILITVLLAGLWHGANWTFILWGAYVGLGIITYRIFDHATSGTVVDRIMMDRRFAPISVFLTFTILLVGAAIFRSPSLNDMVVTLREMFYSDRTGQNMLTSGAFALTLIAFLLAIAEERTRAIQRLATAPAWIQIPAYTCAFLALELFSVTQQTTPFIYFQF